MLLGCLMRDDGPNGKSFFDRMRERFRTRRMPPVPRTSNVHRMHMRSDSSMWGRTDASSLKAKEPEPVDITYSDDDSACADEDDLEFKHYVFGAPREHTDSPRSATSMSSSPRNAIKRE